MAKNLLSQQPVKDFTMKKSYVSLVILLIFFPCVSISKPQKCHETFRTQPSALDFGDRIEMRAYQETIDLKNMTSTGLHTQGVIKRCSVDPSFACWDDDGVFIIAIPKRWKGEPISWAQAGQTFVAMASGTTEILGVKLKTVPVISYVQDKPTDKKSLRSIFLFDESINLIARGQFDENEDISWGFAIGSGLSKSCLIQ